jgi:hypothetical protein
MVAARKGRRVAEPPKSDDKEEATPESPPPTGTPLVLKPPKRPRGWFNEWRYRRKLRIYADMVLIKRAIDLLEGQNAAASVSPDSLEIGKLSFKTTSVDDTLTPHEKVLDNWRIAVTVILILVLFAAVAIVVFHPSGATSATPLLSLISGLAGIALGWMFANAGTNARKSDSTVSRMGRGRTGQGKTRQDGTGQDGTGQDGTTGQ